MNDELKQREQLSALADGQLQGDEFAQAIAAAAEQFGRATEEAAAGEDFLQGLVGFVHAAILESACAQVLLFDLILGQ